MAVGYAQNFGRGIRARAIPAQARNRAYSHGDARTVRGRVRDRPRPGRASDALLCGAIAGCGRGFGADSDFGGFFSFLRAVGKGPAATVPQRPPIRKGWRGSESFPIAQAVDASNSKPRDRERRTHRDNRVSLDAVASPAKKLDVVPRMEPASGYGNDMVYAGI